MDYNISSHSSLKSVERIKDAVERIGISVQARYFSRVVSLLYDRYMVFKALMPEKTIMLSLEQLFVVER
jgi:hypothetical protein